MKKILIIISLMFIAVLSGCTSKNSIDSKKNIGVENIKINQVYGAENKTNSYYYKLIDSNRFVFMTTAADGSETDYYESDTTPQMVYLFGTYTKKGKSIILNGSTSGIKLWFSESEKRPRNKVIDYGVFTSKYASAWNPTQIHFKLKKGKYIFKYAANTDHYPDSLRIVKKTKDLPNSVEEVKTMYHINNVNDPVINDAYGNE